MPEEKSIQIKPSYIQIDPFIRIISSSMVFLMSFFLLAILRVSFLEGSPLLFYLEFAISIVLGALGFGFVLSLERFLKKLSKTWDYSKFCRLQQFSFATLGISIDLLPILLFIIWFFPPLRTDLFYVLLGVLLVDSFALPFYRFYTQNGIAILDYSAFVQDFKTTPEYADFGLIRSGTLAISKIAREANIEIEPYCLSTSLSVGFLQDSKETSDYLTKLIEWAENPRKDGNFEKFRNTVKKYTILSKTLSKEGITEKHRLSFEQKLGIYSLIIVPSIIGILTVVIPELAKILPL